MPTPDDEELAELARQYEDEMTQFRAAGLSLMACLSVEQVMVIVGQIQLAARHPMNKNTRAAQLARGLVEAWASEIGITPTLRKVIDMGWEKA